MLAADPDSALTSEASVARLREAEPLLVESYAGLVDRPSPSAPSEPRAAHLGVSRRADRDRVVRLDDVRGTVEPGMGYDAKTAEWKAKPPSRPAETSR